MPKYQLELKAELASLTGLTPVDYATSFPVSLQLQCTTCNEKAEKEVVVQVSDQHEVPGSRGVSNLVMKCRACGCQGTLDLDTKYCGTYDEESSGKWIPAGYSTETANHGDWQRILIIRKTNSERTDMAFGQVCNHLTTSFPHIGLFSDVATRHTATWTADKTEAAPDLVITLGGDGTLLRASRMFPSKWYQKTAQLSNI